MNLEKQGLTLTVALVPVATKFGTGGHLKLWVSALAGHPKICGDYMYSSTDFLHLDHQKIHLATWKFAQVAQPATQENRP